MSDLKVKIVSNPYSKTIEFAHWDNGWTPVDTFTEPNSKLLNKALVSGFFPFKAKDIISRSSTNTGQIMPLFQSYSKDRKTSSRN